MTKYSIQQTSASGASFTYSTTMDAPLSPEDMEIIRQVQARDLHDSGERISIDDLVSEFNPPVERTFDELVAACQDLRQAFAAYYAAVSP